MEWITKLIKAVCLLPGAGRSPSYSPRAKINVQLASFQNVGPSEKQKTGITVLLYSSPQFWRRVQYLKAG